MNVHLKIPSLGFEGTLVLSRFSFNNGASKERLAKVMKYVHACDKKAARSKAVRLVDQVLSSATLAEATEAVRRRFKWPEGSPFSKAVALAILQDARARMQDEFQALSANLNDACRKAEDWQKEQP